MSDVMDWLRPGEPWSDLGGEVDAHRERLQGNDAYRRYLEDLRAVARTPEGARVICDILDQARTFDPAWSDKNASLARRAVLRDFGQSLLDDLAVAADDVHDDISRMMRVRRKLAETLATNPKE